MIIYVLFYIRFLILQILKKIIYRKLLLIYLEEKHRRYN